MKIIKRLILFIMLLLFLATGSLVIAGLYYGDEIKNLVVTNLNKNLKTEVKVSKVDFSVWESFPNASIVFSDVVIHAVNAKNDTLLSAKKLSAKFNLIDLYQEKYNLIGLGISNGTCKMLVDNSGHANYVFWNESDSSSNPVSIHLEKVTLKKIQFSYVDYSKSVGIAFLIDNTDLVGNFKNQIFDLNAKTTLKNATIQIGETTIVEDRTLFIAMQGNVDQNKEQLNFSSTDLGVDGMNIGITGDLKYGEASELNLDLNSSNTDLEKAIALLPIKVRNSLNRFNIDGETSLTGSIRGDYSSELAPYYQFDFEVNNGIFKDKKSDLSFSKTTLLGSVTNGNNRTVKSTKLVLNSFYTKLNEGELEGKLSLEDFKNPTYSYIGKVSFGLKEVVELLQNKLLVKPSGRIIANIDVEGNLANIDNFDLNDWKNSKIEGKVSLEEINFELNNRPQKIDNLNSKLNFNNKNLEIIELTGSVDKSDFSLQGKFSNLIPYLLEEQENLLVDASLTSNSIDLAELLKSDEKIGVKEGSYELNISEKLTVYLKLKVDKLSFNKFNLKDLKGDLVIRNKRIDARNIAFNTQEGKVEGDLFIREKGNQLSIISEAEFTEVDIQKTFESFGNFGQNSLKSEHLRGKANIDVSINTLWSKNFEIDPKSIKSNLNFTIENGELLNYKPMEALSRFVELEELRAIKFNELSNQILIQNELITIPRFEILSTALNLSIEGTHSFNNDINYHITLLLSEVLGKKVKKPTNSEFGYVEDDGLSKKSKLFLKMSGTVDNPKIAYDTKELKNTLTKKLAAEKNSVKSILKEEFGFFKKDSTVKKLPVEKKQYSPFSVEIDSSFIKSKNTSKSTQDKGNKRNEENESKKKSKFGKFLDKIAQPNNEEFVAPIEN